MAKSAWLTVSPKSGNGRTDVSNRVSAHTGREPRRTTATVTGVGAKKPATYTATQKAKKEFVSFVDGIEMSAPQEGGAVTVNLKSNSASLNFSFVGDSNQVELPATYSANGLSVQNGQAIPGDPGAKSEYDSNVQLQLPSNGTTDEVPRILKVTAAGGQAAQITINQAAGEAYVRVSPTEIVFEADGSNTVNVTIESNTQWTIE